MLDLVVTCFGILMGLSPLLQALRIHKRRHSADVSLAMLLIILVGAGLWLVYGIEHSLASVIIANSVGVVASAIAVATTLFYRNTPEPEH